MATLKGSSNLNHFKVHNDILKVSLVCELSIEHKRYLAEIPILCSECLPLPYAHLPLERLGPQSSKLLSTLPLL